MSENLEEGQLEEHSSVARDAYDPAHEWPGDDGPISEDTKQPSRSNHPTFRLVVLQSSILPSKQKIAVIDAYSEVQLGRDSQPTGSVTPRIRLKEMDVSKLHATLFWDGAKSEWSIVDMGSMHGTFVQVGPASLDIDNKGIRLSQSRAASIPRRLRHSDLLSIGSTTFVVHIHENQYPCPNCIMFGKEEIPLFPSPSKNAAKRTRDAAGLDSPTTEASTLDVNRNPKKALNMLKRSLLTRHDGPTTGNSVKSSDYIDRAARRRLLHPSSRPDSPGVPHLSMPTMGSAKNTPSTSAHEEPEPSLAVSQPPTPLSSSNIGHRLLMQQGWAPGSGLGTPLGSSDGRTRLVNPLEIKSTQNRAGLGMKPAAPLPLESEAASSGLNWKEQHKFRRFEAQR